MFFNSNICVSSKFWYLQIKKSTSKQNIAKFTININQCKKLLGFYIPFYAYMHIYLDYSKFLQYVVWVQIFNKEY